MQVLFHDSTRRKLTASSLRRDTVPMGCDALKLEAWANDVRVLSPPVHTQSAVRHCRETQGPGGTQNKHTSAAHTYKQGTYGLVARHGQKGAHEGAATSDGRGPAPKTSQGRKGVHSGVPVLGRTVRWGSGPPLHTRSTWRTGSSPSTQGRGIERRWRPSHRSLNQRSPAGKRTNKRSTTRTQAVRNRATKHGVRGASPLPPLSDRFPSPLRRWAALSPTHR
jgi:hypothetical protein